MHRGEIPSGTTVELRGYESEPSTEQDTDAFSGKSLAELIEKIGIVSGLPEDLATNPIYMEGFGEAKRSEERS